jgi:hypothetical protein
MRLPYEFSLSHHQLLFNICAFILLKQIWKLFSLKASIMIFLQSAISELVI